MLTQLLGDSKNYIIFNEREQVFDHIKGYTNKQLSLHKQDCELALQCQEKDSQNRFHPQFYPRRYKLKDVIYEQVLFGWVIVLKKNREL